MARTLIGGGQFDLADARWSQKHGKEVSCDALGTFAWMADIQRVYVALLNPLSFELIVCHCRKNSYTPLGVYATAGECACYYSQEDLSCEGRDSAHVGACV